MGKLAQDVLLESIEGLVRTGGNLILGRKNIEEGQDVRIAGRLQDLDHPVERGDQIVRGLVDATEVGRFQNGLQTEGNVPRTVRVVQSGRRQHTVFVFAFFRGCISGVERPSIGQDAVRIPGDAYCII